MEEAVSGRLQTEALRRGTRYTVDQTDTLVQDGAELVGQIEYRKAQIHLAKSLDPAVKRVTLLHEITHGICEAYGIEADEATVDRIANGFNATLEDNKDLVNLF